MIGPSGCVPSASKGVYAAFVVEPSSGDYTLVRRTSSQGCPEGLQAGPVDPPDVILPGSHADRDGVHRGAPRESAASAILRRACGLARAGPMLRTR